MAGLFRIVPIAGPNGAGKTSFARQYLPSLARTFIFLNADDIARELTAHGNAPRDMDLAAGREMLKSIKARIAEKADIMIETTLAGEAYARQIPGWQEQGYMVELYYLRLACVEDSIERVRRRVMNKGHNIP